jgi:rod shape-determining protein MreB
MFEGLFVKEIGIDLGTVNTIVVLRGKGVVLREPTICALSADKERLLAVGRQAQQLVGRTPEGISIEYPLQDGVIADMELTAALLQDFVRRCGRGFSLRRRAVVCIPAQITAVERRAVEEAARRMGIHSLRLIDEPTAAALGAGLEPEQTSGCMVVDIGGGTTDVAILCASGTAVRSSVRLGGRAMDEAIIRYVRERKGALIGQPTAEQVKLELGCADGPGEGSLCVAARDLVTALPMNLTLNEQEIYRALSPLVEKIIRQVRRALQQASPELAGDIFQGGIVLTGGGAKLRGLAGRLEKACGISTRCAEDALDCVALGILRAMEKPKRQGRLRRQTPTGQDASLR